MSLHNQGTLVSPISISPSYPFVSFHRRSASTLRRQRAHDLNGGGRQRILSQWLSIEELDEKDDVALAEKISQELSIRTIAEPVHLRPEVSTPHTAPCYDGTKSQLSTSRSKGIDVAVHRGDTGGSLTSKPPSHGLSVSRLKPGNYSAPPGLSCFDVALPQTNTVFFTIGEDDVCYDGEITLRHISEDPFATSPSIPEDRFLVEDRWSDDDEF